jgi:hypothetical protein
MQHTYIHTHTNTHTHTHSDTEGEGGREREREREKYIKSADDEDQHIEDVFNTLVSITERSGNLRKDLKNDILESVSTLRKVFSKMKTAREQD